MSESGTPSINPDETSCFGLPRSTRILAYYVQSILGIGLILLNIIPSIIDNSKSYSLILGVIFLFTSSLWTNPPNEYFKQLINPIRLISFIILVVTLILYWCKPELFITKYFLIGACFWYFLSFIPGGQEWCKNCLNGCFKNSMKSEGKNENFV